MYLSDAHVPRVVRRPLSLRTSVVFWHSSKTQASHPHTLFRHVTRTQSFVLNPKKCLGRGFNMLEYSNRVKYQSVEFVCKLSTIPCMGKTVGLVFFARTVFSTPLEVSQNRRGPTWEIAEISPFPTIGFL